MKGQSRELAELRFKRIGPGVAIMGDRLYVIGGTKERYWEETLRNLTE